MRTCLSRSARTRGVVFAGRAGTRIEWRVVPFEVGDLKDDRLALVGYARCTPDTLRHLPAETQVVLYGLWERARDDIVKARDDEADPAKRDARVPKAQRVAVGVLYGSMRLEPVVVERSVEALAVPWPPTVARSLREILDHPDASAEAKAEQIVQFVTSEGLRPPKVMVEAPISKDDVHLVCYQVIDG